MEIQDTSRRTANPDRSRPGPCYAPGARISPPASGGSTCGELLIGALLFFASAAFVLWQDSRLAVLWDLSYILENATRIALGQVPYRDFPFPYAPLTFVMQAAIIKLSGRVVLHHYIYAAVASGCATLLTWRILLRLLRSSALPARLAAFLLGAPLVFLGTGSIFPHPFYDSDCTLLILFCLWLLLRLESRGWPRRSTFAGGMLLALPLFVKQNTGLAFLLAIASCIAWWALRSEAGNRNPRRAAALLLGGAAAGLGLALTVIHYTCGAANYYHWTVQFAASRRLPGVATMLGVYRDPALLWSFVVFALGMSLLRLPDREPASRLRSAARWMGCALLSAPFLWTVAALALQADDSDRAEALLHLWPVLLAASFVCALWRLRRAATFADLIPLVAWGAVHGAFLSQQLWGSTYALWPLLMLLLASILVALAPKLPASPHLPTAGQCGPPAPVPVFPAPLMAFTSVAALTLLIAGGHYALSHERLSYADLSGETLRHSTLPPLRGLAMRGDWLPDFEELVAYSKREIPAQDAILTIPGEDLFYFTTGRPPQLPVVMIDNTVNPYSAEQLAALARQRRVGWVVVKRNLQLQEEPVAFRPQLMQLLAREYEKVESLNNYDIYRRRED